MCHKYQTFDYTYSMLSNSLFFIFYLPVIISMVWPHTANLALSHAQQVENYEEKISLRSLLSSWLSFRDDLNIEFKCNIVRWHRRWNKARPVQVEIPSPKEMSLMNWQPCADWSRHKLLLFLNFTNINLKFWLHYWCYLASNWLIMTLWSVRKLI